MFILVNKPLGPTSFQVTKRFRKLLQIKSIGHLGTLDPAASGLMILATEPKFLPYLQKPYYENDIKVYGFKIRFGTATDTFDLEGKIVEQNDVRPTLLQIQEAVPNFIGPIEQIPPKFSAIHVNGKRAYELARAGQDFEIPKRKITIFKLECVATDSSKNVSEAQFVVHCSAGTYVRTLAIDIAKNVGCIGTVSVLHRYAVGPFSIDGIDDYRFEKLDIFKKIYPIICLSNAELAKLRNGAVIETQIFDDSVRACVNENDEFCGIVKCERGTIFPLRMVKIYV